MAADQNDVRTPYRTSFCSQNTRRKLLDGMRAAFHTELALRSERDRTSRCNYEIPITLLARAFRKHMRVVAALTEKVRTRHRVASRLAVDLPQIAGRISAIITTRDKEEHSMMDVIVLGLALGFFAPAIGYAHVCERL